MHQVDRDTLIGLAQILRDGKWRFVPLSHTSAVDFAERLERIAETDDTPEDPVAYTKPTPTKKTTKKKTTKKRK